MWNIFCLYFSISNLCSNLLCLIKNTNCVNDNKIFPSVCHLQSFQTIFFHILWNLKISFPFLFLKVVYFGIKNGYMLFQISYTLWLEIDVLVAYLVNLIWLKHTFCCKISSKQILLITFFSNRDNLHIKIRNITIFVFRFSQISSDMTTIQYEIFLRLHYVRYQWQEFVFFIWIVYFID